MNSVASSPARTVVALGVPFHDLTLAEAIDRVADAVADRTPRYLATANLDFALQANRDVELQRILVEADYVLCDGTPLLWTTRLLGVPLRERVAGSDLVPQLIARAARENWRVFLLGGSADSLSTALANLRQKHPDLQIDGYSPPLSALLEMEHEAIFERVRAAQPDVLLVGFGCPKQEKWIYMHYARLGVPVSMGVGATIDFLAGKFHRAPRWLAACGGEWLFRLAQEPRRLAGRYFADFRFLGGAVLRDWMHWRWRAPRRRGSAITLTKSPHVRVWSGEVDAAAIADGHVQLPDTLVAGTPLALDLSGVSFMDSAGLGLLLKLYRQTARAGVSLVLLSPSAPVRDLLAAVKLDRLFVITELTELDRLPLAGGAVPFDARGSRLDVDLEGELTAANVPERSQRLKEIWQQQSQARQLILNLSGLRFIDSAGLGMLIAAHKFTRTRPGAELRITGVTGNVRAVIQQARLDRILRLEHAA